MTELVIFAVGLLLGFGLGVYGVLRLSQWQAGRRDAESAGWEFR